MKLFKLLPMVLLVLTITSCATDARMTESDVATTQESNSTTQTQSTNETDPEDDPELTGFWSLESATYFSSTSYTENGVNTYSEVNGIATDIDHTIIFSDSPNEVTGEGSFNFTLNTNDSTYITEGHSIVKTSGTWQTEEDFLTFNFDSVIVQATILTLDDEFLSLEVSRLSTGNSGQGSVEKSQITTYNLVRL